MITRDPLRLPARPTVRRQQHTLRAWTFASSITVWLLLVALTADTVGVVQIVLQRAAIPGIALLMAGFPLDLYLTMRFTARWAAARHAEDE
jgi:hypothetical protein